MCTERTQFIDLGYQARSQGHRGNSPAEWSQSKPQRKGLVLLSSSLSHEVGICSQTSKWSTLHFAVKEGLVEIAELLLKSGANVELQDKVR